MIVYIPQEKVSRWFSPKFKIFITTISFKFLCVGFKKIKNCFIYYLLKKKNDGTDRFDKKNCKIHLVF